MHHRFLAAAAVAACFANSGFSGHASPGPVDERRNATAVLLSDFEGRFAYRDAPLDIVAHQGRLYAVLEDIAYPLTALSGDLFRNAAGQPVEFLRDREGRVIAVKEGVERFEKQSDQVSTRSRALLIPRDGGPYHYSPPALLGDGLAVGSLGRGSLPQGLAATIVEGVVSGRFSSVHSVLVYHRGQLVMEEYFHGFDLGRPHQMRSLTKGVIALSIGAAIDQDRISLGEAPLPALAVSPENLSSTHRAVTVADLLAMRTRLSCDDESDDASINNQTLYQRDDWVQAFAAAPIKSQFEPLESYCSAGMLAAGRFLEMRTGAPIRDFARDVLFRPLGIADDAWAWPFVLGAKGANEFGQIRLRPRDMMKIGVMVLQDGRFADRQILSRNWIEAMTTRQSVIDGDAWGYGLWLRDYRVDSDSGAQTVATIMFSGNGGQKIYVVPSLDLVVVSTGGSYNQGNAPINAIIAQVILPAALQARKSGEPL
jgi:CubicO group peptidase (beta-lactamase class C family)